MPTETAETVETAETAETVENQEIDQIPENQEEPESNEPEEVTVTIGEQEPEEDHHSAPEWVKDLRRKHREIAKENRELKAKLQQQEETQKPIVGQKPTLEGCDYDTEQYDRELSSWYDRKRQADEESRRIQEEQDAQERSWKEKLNAYDQEKLSLKVSDYDEAEDIVKSMLSVTQQGIIISGSKKASQIIYALGRNPARLQELAQISDPVSFAVAIGEIGAQLKIMPKRIPETKPETKVIGGAPTNASEAALDKLRAEAEKTGDYSKVHAYKRQLRQQAT